MKMSYTRVLKRGISVNKELVGGHTCVYAYLQLSWEGMFLAVYAYL